MTGPVIHRELSREEALHYIWWDQVTDPFVSNPSDVQPGHVWRNPTTYEIKERNAAHTGWTSKGFLMSEAMTTLFARTFVLHGNVPAAMTGGRKLTAGSNVTISLASAGKVIISSSGIGESGAGLPGDGLTGEILAKVSATDFDVEWRSVASLFSRADIDFTTASLNDDSSEDVDLEGFGKSAELYKIEVSKAAWVVGYQTDAARTADVSRLISEDPETATGVLFEFVTETDDEVVVCQPRPACENHDDPVDDVLYLRVTNLSGGTTAITVTLTRIITEE